MCHQWRHIQLQRWTPGAACGCGSPASTQDWDTHTHTLSYTHTHTHTAVGGLLVMPVGIIGAGVLLTSMSMSRLHTAQRYINHILEERIYLPPDACNQLLLCLASAVAAVVPSPRCFQRSGSASHEKLGDQPHGESWTHVLTTLAVLTQQQVQLLHTSNTYQWEDAFHNFFHVAGTTNDAQHVAAAANRRYRTQHTKAAANTDNTEPTYKGGTGGQRLPGP